MVSSICAYLPPINPCTPASHIFKIICSCHAVGTIVDINNTEIEALKKAITAEWEELEDRSVTSNHCPVVNREHQ
jgi:hypothetical protein